MRSVIAALDAGTAYHHEALRGSRFAHFIDRTIWLPELPEADLSDVDILIVTCRSHPGLLTQNREKLMGYARSGGFLVVMGETRADSWLAGVQWVARPTNWWWWLEKGATLGLSTPKPSHGLWRYLKPQDCEWHYHGVLTPPLGAESILVLPDGGTLFYEDTASFAPGRAIVMTLDPFYHHGSHFMPATTRFLDGFLPWLRAEADSKNETLQTQSI